MAVKVIDTSQGKECADNVKKEICIHKVGVLLACYVSHFSRVQSVVTPHTHFLTIVLGNAKITQSN